MMVRFMDAHEVISQLTGKPMARGVVDTLVELGILPTYQQHGEHTVLAGDLAALAGLATALVDFAMRVSYSEPLLRSGRIDAFPIASHTNIELIGSDLESACQVGLRGLLNLPAAQADILDSDMVVPYLGRSQLRSSSPRLVEAARAQVSGLTQ
jgi:hypothetical protein